MNQKIKLLFVKTGFLRINKTNIEKWAKNFEFDIIDYVFDNNDFWTKKDIIKSLQNVKHDRSIKLFERGLDTNILPVVESAVESIKSQGLYSIYSLRIENILQSLKRKNEEFKKNWKKPPKMSKSLYIDKSEMVRLKQLKALLAKPKSSMSIG